MPFDPAQPAEGSPLSSEVVRNQFNGLNDALGARIDAIPAGPQGPPFASAVVDGVNTLNPGDAATVSASFDGTNVHLIFGIPRGETGSEGAPGPQGAPGEVSNQQLIDTVNSAVAGTAQNPAGVAPFAGTFSDPPTQAEMFAFAAWAETLRAALAR